MSWGDVMRRIVTILLCTLFLLAACSKSDLVEEHVKVFQAIDPDADLSTTSFSAKEALAMQDLVQSECPTQPAGEKFSRSTLESSAWSLVVYSSDDAITCSILKPKPAQMVQSGSAPDEETLVSVNGEPITREALRERASVLPQGSLDDNTTLRLLESLIDDQLLAQAAAAYEPEDKDRAFVRQSLLATLGATEDTLAQTLERSGSTMEEFERILEEQSRVRALLRDRLLLDDIEITDEQAKNYYVTNPNEFIRSEQATARFIYISALNRTTEQGQAIADRIASELPTRDFCELVNEYSDDAPAKPNCGVYVIPRGVVDPQLELAAFGTPAGETAVIATEQGIYFIQTLQVSPTQVVAFPQVSESLKAGIENIVVQQRLNLLIATLRTQADIVSYVG
jgi:peptidyl-prolyl cis-trans isomerase C